MSDKQSDMEIKVLKFNLSIFFAVLKNLLNICVNYLKIGRRVTLFLNNLLNILEICFDFKFILKVLIFSVCIYNTFQK